MKKIRASLSRPPGILANSSVAATVAIKLGRTSTG